MKLKGLFILSAAVVVFQSSTGQDTDAGKSDYSISVQYNHELVLDGYVQVREWELLGDRMELRALGMITYPALQFQLEKRFRKGTSLAIAYDRFFMRGKSVFERDITYNGTIINGRNGIDVSPTRYFRITASFSGPLVDHMHFDLKYNAALVLDHITFYLDGEVVPSSPSTEVFEGFGRQAFPYPVVGLQGDAELNDKSIIGFEVSGTYIPEFKSFYTESGNVHLAYRNFLTDLSYSRSIFDFDVAVGAKFRYLYLFQESREDTNIISTLTFGPYIEVSYQF